VKRLALIVLLALGSCQTSTERIATSANEVEGLARSSGRRFERIHTETYKPEPSLPTIRGESEAGIVEQEQIMGLVDAITYHLTGTTNNVPWWATLLTYALIFGSIVGAFALCWWLGIGRLVRGWLGIITPRERAQAQLAAEMIDAGDESVRERVWRWREEDKIFDAAFRRAAPIRKASGRKRSKKGSSNAGK
jgi:hypothetical protein